MLLVPLEVLAIEAACSPLDIAGHHATIPQWERLCAVLLRVHTSFLPSTEADARRLPCWSGRLGWWQATHFPSTLPPSSTKTNYIERANVKRRKRIVTASDADSGAAYAEVLRAACAYHMFGRDDRGDAHPFVRVVLQRLRERQDGFASALLSLIQSYGVELE
jgi:hypothetical protein